MSEQLTYTSWLADTGLACFVILAIASLAVLLARQPARQIRLIEGALLACLLVAMLSSIAGWSRWSLQEFVSVDDSSLRSSEIDGEPDAAANVMIPVNDFAGRAPEHVVRMDEDPAAGESSVPSSVVADAPAVSESPPVHIANDSMDWPAIIGQSMQVTTAAVAVLLFGAWLFAVWSLWRRSRQCEPAPDWARQAFDAIAGPAGASVRLLVDRQRAHACTFGWLRPVVVLPGEICRQADDKTLRWMLAHEWSHVVRRDARAWHLIGLLAPLCYFQPAFWWLRRQLRLCQEYLADADAATQAGCREDYAEFLVHAVVNARAQFAVSPLTLGPFRSDLHARVVRLLDRRTRLETTCPRWWSSVVAVVAVVLVGVASSVTLRAAPPVQTTAPEKSDGEKSDAAQLEDADAVHVRVVDLSGQPRSNVPVRAIVSSSRRAVDVKVVTDEDGRAAISRSRFDPHDRYRFEVKPDQRSLGWKQFWAGKGAPAATAEEPLVITVLPLTRQIRGHVVDASSKPVAGLHIRVVSLNHAVNGSVWVTREPPLADGITNEQGNYTIKLPVETTVLLTVRHRRYTGPRISVDAARDTIETLTVIPAGSIIGIAADEKGNGVAGVAVGAQLIDQYTEYGDGWGDAVTGADGVYRIEGLVPGVYNVLFMGDTKRPQLTARAAEGVRVTGGEDALADMRVIHGRRLHGTVWNSALKQPFAEAYVGYYGSARPRSGAAIMGAYTDAIGNFELFVPPGESYVYIAQMGHRGPETNTTLIVPEDRDPEPIRLTTDADPSLGVRGVVRDKNGKGIANATVRVTGMQSLRLPVVPTQTGSDGRFEITGLAATTTVALIVDHEDYARSAPRKVVVAAGSEPITIELAPATKVRVSGQVDGPDGKPLAGAKAQVFLAVASGSYWSWGTPTTTNGKGEYVFHHPRVGDTIYVHVEKQGFDGGNTPKATIQNGTGIILGNVALQNANGGNKDAKRPNALPKVGVEFATRTVRGTVVDQDDNPVPGARVSYNGRKYIAVATDRGGKFILKNLPDGELNIGVSRRGYATKRVTVLPNDERLQVIVDRQ